jgi:hypothetical protein
VLDDAGIDFMLPIARRIGYGGETNFHGNVLETVTWATGLVAQTRQLTVFATVHTAANHPVVVAKQIATIATSSAAAGPASMSWPAGTTRNTKRWDCGCRPTTRPVCLRRGVVWAREEALAGSGHLRLGRRALPAQRDSQRAQAVWRP